MAWAVVAVALVVGQVAPAPQVPPPSIGWAEIEAAKTLLAQARQSLQPQQYQVLEKGLVEAEGAFQRFSKLARASGQAAEVARGAEALTGAQRLSQIARGAGPVLVALALLYPSSTATQEQDYPSWMKARHELEMRLRQVAADSQRVGEEIEAARRSAGREGAAKATGATSQKGSGQPPDDPPCHHVGTQGSGAHRPPGSPPSMMTCWYECGGKSFPLKVLGTSSLDCEKPEQFERAWKEDQRIRRSEERR